MIFNLLKNFLLALLLDAGAALAFDFELDEAQPLAAAPQSCTLPVSAASAAAALTAEPANLPVPGTHS